VTLIGNQYNIISFDTAIPRGIPPSFRDNFFEYGSNGLVHTFVSRLLVPSCLSHFSEIPTRKLYGTSRLQANWKAEDTDAFSAFQMYGAGRHRLKAMGSVIRWSGGRFPFGTEHLLLAPTPMVAPEI
jgi:hypothetical protein